MTISDHHPECFYQKVTVKKHIFAKWWQMQPFHMSHGQTARDILKIEGGWAWSGLSTLHSLYISIKQVYNTVQCSTAFVPSYTSDTDNG